MKHIFTIAFLICIFPILSVHAMDQYQEYLQLMDKHKNTSVSVPNKHLFDGMTRYAMSDIRLSADKQTAYDSNGNLLTGVVEMSPTILKSFKNGKVDGPTLYQSGNHIIFMDFRNNMDHGSVSLRQEFFDGKLILESINNDMYLYSRRYYLSGKLAWDVINNLDMGIIMRGYDKDGIKNIEINTFNKTATCFLRDGSKRMASQEERQAFMSEQEKSGESLDYEFDFSCEE